MNSVQVMQAEDELVKQAQAGDRDAYGVLVCRYTTGVVQVVYRMCGQAQLAEDAAQDAFLRAWLKLPDYQPRGSFRSWLYRIAINAALDALRRKPAANIEDEETALLTDPQPGPEAVVLAKELAQRVQSAVQTLPQGVRAVVVLREYGSLSYQEISDVLGIPLGTVMSRLNFGRNKLRQALEWYPAEMESEYV